MSSISPIESAKKLAAYKAVDENLPPNAKVIGIGSGSTVVYVAERIGQIFRNKKDDIVCISTGFQSKQLIIDNGLKLGTIEQHPILDIAFDGADEVDHDLNLIKGGGACLFQEKLIASASKKLIIVADFRKQSTYLGENWKQGVPIEVVPIAFTKLINDLKDLGALEVNLRQGGKFKAGPVITDNNNFILDANFGIIKDPKNLHFKLKSLVGVIETGLFTEITEKVYFGENNGEISIWGGDNNKNTEENVNVDTVIEESK
ncbi:RKI1 [Candida pseudojiufengensis]|uniref:RKI1 n=1 Tax=Candida pseudojiufengensis TaxID=497109 RepID=UPI0022241E2E|nr:RKI1 [Candida pseudojiufengensis]KAI5968045.1 RKI1 [Candida pseudojiufengensis]